MMMRFEQQRLDKSETSVLPLINVVFLLLIFFMLAGSLMIIEPFAVQAPDSMGEGTTENATLRLLLGKNQALALDGQLIQENDLLAHIKRRIAANPDLRIALKADAELAGNYVVLLLERLREAGVERVYLMTLWANP